ncbi:MAG: cytochrome C [Chlorobiaceae bacterium]|nr:cytochrome C [Chlorobiaceae bacterium]NTV61819.1 cytochrome C [Chlorobiaceae bacterium]
MNPFIEIITQPDNIAIVIMIIMVTFFTLWAFQQAFENDRLIAAGKPVDGENEGLVDTFKPLVRIELIIALAVMVFLTFWSIVVDAPLEEIANPTLTPNPAKAPWYFLGLQELLVYFDPWLAGVVLPTLIIVGLIAIPYIDINPKGNGYYCFNDRKFAVITFSFGFFILWLLLIVIGVFFRGPGWLWYWPWQEWDHARVVFEPTRDLSNVFGIDSRSLPGFIIGAIVVNGYLIGGMILPYRYLKDKMPEFMKQFGLIRYLVTASLFITMMAIPVKMVLWLVFHIKYIWITPWFNV